MFTRVVVISAMTLVVALAAPVHTHAATILLAGGSQTDVNTTLASLSPTDPYGGERWVAQARIGDRGGAATYEIGLHGAPNFTGTGPLAPTNPSGSTQFAWGDNQFVDFSLTRTADLVTFSMGNYVASILDPTANTLVLRLFATTTNGPHVTKVEDLDVDGLTLSVISTTDGALNWVFTGLAASFSVTGRMAFDWNDSFSAPANSNMAMQLKGFETTPVPEPVALVLLSVGTAALALRRRR